MAANSRWSTQLPRLRTRLSPQRPEELPGIDFVDGRQASNRTATIGVANLCGNWKRTSSKSVDSALSHTDQQTKIKVRSAHLRVGNSVGGKASCTVQLPAHSVHKGLLRSHLLFWTVVNHIPRARNLCSLIATQRFAQLDFELDEHGETKKVKSVVKPSKINFLSERLITTQLTRTLLSSL